MYQQITFSKNKKINPSKIYFISASN